MESSYLLTSIVNNKCSLSLSALPWQLCCIMDTGGKDLLHPKIKHFFLEHEWTTPLPPQPSWLAIKGRAWTKNNMSVENHRSVFGSSIRGPLIPQGNISARFYCKSILILASFYLWYNPWLSTEHCIALLQKNISSILNFWRNINSWFFPTPVRITSLWLAALLGWNGSIFISGPYKHSNNTIYLYIIYIFIDLW